MRYSHVQLYSLILFLSLSLFCLCTVCYSSTTFHCHLLLFHFSKRYRAYVTQCWFLWAFARGVSFFSYLFYYWFYFYFFFRNAVIQYTAILLSFISLQLTHSLTLVLLTGKIAICSIILNIIILFLFLFICVRIYAYHRRQVSVIFISYFSLIDKAFCVLYY